MKREDQMDYKDAEHCHICEGELGEDKVLDHCHLTGKYRGAAHNECNLNYKIPKFFPVIFLNLSGYDSHRFIKKLGKSKGKLNCIASNEEKYISFTKKIIVDEFKNKEGEKVEVKRDIRFIDSFKFMASSLDTLTSNLPRDSFNNTQKFYKGKELELLLREGVFPYDWFDGYNRLYETRLPPKESFYSALKLVDIADEDYKHGQEVCETFKMSISREYHDLYLKSDVLLLADVFENFRDVCLNNYRLDPAWYYTAPGLAWDACLKNTRVKLELLTDPDLLLLFEAGIRGGVLMIINRYGRANNPYMKDYNQKEEKKYLTYLDANNLYGWALSKPLPVGDFRWMSEGELEDWQNIPCVLEVDLEYPEELHDLHNDYPLAPETLVVKFSSYKNLRQYLSLGLRLKEIHRGITFSESDWLKPYIELNTNLRAAANNDFEKDFFKVMNNSVFGKTMENIRNRRDINLQLVTNEVDAKKLISKPNYRGKTIFCKTLAAIHMKKTKLVFNKPVYLGMSILEISKTLMYDFHYNYIKKKYGERAKLLFTDTVSLCYEIRTEDFYKDIAPDVKSTFDTSNFNKDHRSGIETGINKKVIGMFKDEAGGRQITEFIGLRSKLYSYRMDDLKEEKKCKGITKAIIKKTITFEDYKNCLFKEQNQMRNMKIIRSELHDIYTMNVNKVTLSHKDDKRIIKEDKVHTYAYGHFRTLSGANSVSSGTT